MPVRCDASPLMGQSAPIIAQGHENGVPACHRFLRWKGVTAKHGSVAVAYLADRVISTEAMIAATWRNRLARASLRRLGPGNDVISTGAATAAKWRNHEPVAIDAISPLRTLRVLRSK